MIDEVFFRDRKCEVKIDLERNEVFKCELAAYKHARENRSYHYQIFDHNGKHAGYSVPK